jgi:hypothetical protein
MMRRVFEEASRTHANEVRIPGRRRPRRSLGLRCPERPVFIRDLILKYTTDFILLTHTELLAIIERIDDTVEAPCLQSVIRKLVREGKPEKRVDPGPGYPPDIMSRKV